MCLGRRLVAAGNAPAEQSLLTPLSAVCADGSLGSVQMGPGLSGPRANLSERFLTVARPGALRILHARQR